MASLHEIKCINKDERKNPYERILRVGGINPNGQNWYISNLYGNIWNNSKAT